MVAEKVKISQSVFLNLIRAEWDGLEKNVIVNSISSMKIEFKLALMLKEAVLNIK